MKQFLKLNIFLPLTILFLGLLLLPGVLISATEVLTPPNYVEIDVAADRLSLVASQVTFTALGMDEDVYLYADKGAGYFGDFTHTLEVELTGSTDWKPQAVVYGLSNEVGNTKGHREGLGINLQGGTNTAHYVIRLYENVAWDNNFSVDSLAIELNTPYYLTITRLGTSLTLTIYTDANRLNIHDTLSLTVDSRAYQHIYAASSWNDGLVDKDISGYTKDLDIDIGGAPQSDTAAPSISNPQPTGTLSAGTTQTTISLDADELATCKYSTTAGISYDLMTNTFSTTGGTTHSTLVTGLSDGNSYIYYVRCQDTSNNQNTTDFQISFSIAEPSPPDTIPPNISNIQVTNITASGATVIWITDDLSDSTVNYGLTTSLNLTQSDASLVTSHLTNLISLSSETLYYYQITSCNSDNYCSDSSTFSFTTSAPSTGDSTVVGVLSLAPTFEHIGVVSPFSDDNNESNQAVLEYREVGSSVWKSGVAMTVDRRDELMEFGSGIRPNTFKNQWRAVIFGLQPNTEYEARVIYTDPDGVTGSPIVNTVRTRNDNPPSLGDTYYVSFSGSDANPGTIGAPFRTIQHAADIVQAGDRVLVVSGTYNESVEVTASGQEDNYITFESSVEHGAILNGGGYNFQLSGNYIRIKGFDLRNPSGGHAGNVKVGGRNGNVVGSIIEDNIMTDPSGQYGASCVLVGASEKTLIQRNQIQTTGTGPANYFGILFWDTYGGNVVRDNDIITEGVFKDGIGSMDNFHVEDGPGPNSFVYDNYIYGPWDDAIELEGGDMNVAIWGNFTKNSNALADGAPMNMMLGLAAVVVGPMYAIGNVVVDHVDAAVKMGSDSYGNIYLYHNTIYSTRTGQGICHFGNNAIAENITSRNNLIYLMGSTADGRIICNWDTSGDKGFSSYDYEGVWTGREWAEGFDVMWYNTQYRGLENFQSATDQMQHSILISDPMFVDTANDNLRLQPGSLAIDKGVVLPGINNQNSLWAFRGSAPDLGAYEYNSGAPSPSFTISSTNQLYLFHDQSNLLEITGSNFDLTTSYYLKFIQGTTEAASFTVQTQNSSTINLNLTTTQINTLPVGFYDLKLERTTDSISQTHTKQILVTVLGDIWSQTATEIAEQKRDGKVDIYDVSRLLSKWGSTAPGDLAEADINPGPGNVSQGAVDLYDANLTMKNWLP